MLPFYEFIQNRTYCQVDKNLNFPLHLHKQVEIYYAITGGGEIQIGNGNTQRKMQAGDIAIVFPNISHSYSSAENTMHLIAIFECDFCGSYKKDFLEYISPYPFVSEKDVTDEMKFCLNAMINNKNIEQEKRLLKGYLYILLHDIFNIVMLEKRTVDDADISTEIMDYIMKNFKDKITLDILSQKIGVSKYQLSRIFNTKIGVPFNTYLNTIRLDFAQTLILETGLSMTEIAYDCGFESERTFYRAFEQIYKTSPLKYRKSRKES